MSAFALSISLVVNHRRFYKLPKLN